MPLAVVILNYRTPDDAIAAVQRLQRDRAPFTIILVDNASGDGSAARFQQELTAVQLIVAGSNGGFSAGCNLGIRAALDQDATSILLLNPDVVIDVAAIAALDNVLRADPTLGIVAPLLLTESKIQSAGIRWSATSGRMRHREFNEPASTMPPFETRVVDGVSGCAMLVKREVFERIGLLTDEFFFGFEDLDFCLRAKDAGFRTACAGTVTAQHEGNASIGRTSPRRVYFATRNHLLLAARRLSGASWFHRLATAKMVLALNLAHVLFTSDVPRRAGLRAFFRGARDHFAGRYGPPPVDL